MRRVLAIAPALLLTASAAAASTEAEWEKFRSEVETACAALVDAPDYTETKIEVNPFGSESYGAALVSVHYPGEAGTDRMICIYDKESASAELTAPFTPEQPDIKPTAPR
ncbi:MAG: hypothetical protein Q4F71_10950 [Paracoccus sp. (in: a-proteobacteria)]|nr:hypothetical protein [Paracoccus sp. (in: a-proteobacteria)]